MPRKPKVELPANLEFKKSDGPPINAGSQVTPETSTNPFIPAIKDSWETGEWRKVMVPADAEDTARAQIRNAASICDYGARTGVERGKNRDGDDVSIVHFKAAAKRKRNPNGSGSDSGTGTATAEEKVAANAAYSENAEQHVPDPAPVKEKGKGKGK